MYRNLHRTGIQLCVALVTIIGCRHVSTSSVPEYMPPTLQLHPHYQVDFTTRHEGCRGHRDYNGHAEFILDGGNATLVLEMVADDPFAGMPINVSPPQPPRVQEPIRCRWQGYGDRTPSSFEATLDLQGSPAHCGEIHQFSVACEPWSAMIADADGARAPMEGVHCLLHGPYPEVLWVLETGGAISLGATALHSNVKHLGLGGSVHHMTRKPDIED